MDVVQDDAGSGNIDSGYAVKMTENTPVVQAEAGPDNVDAGIDVEMTEYVDSGNVAKMTENTPVVLAEAGTGNVDAGNGVKMTGNVDSGNAAEMTDNTPVAQAGAGPENVDSGNGAKMTENADSGNGANMTDNTPMAISEKNGGGVDTRLRRRSKYLSYPYTNGGPKDKDLPPETEEPRTPGPSVKAKASGRTGNSSNGSISSSKLGSKKFRSYWDRKFSRCSSVSSSPEFINASSSDLLSGLYSTAVDCMSSLENKNSDLVEWFFCKHRIAEYRDEAELATSLINANGGKTEKPVGNGLVDTKSEKKRKNTKMENAAARRKVKPLSGLTDMRDNVSTGDCTNSGKKLNQKRKVEEVISFHQLQNLASTINYSGNNCSSVPEIPQNHNFLASQKTVVPKKKQKLEAAQVNHSVQFAPRADAKSTFLSSIVIDLQQTPPIPVDIHGKSNGQNKGGLVSTASEAGTASQEGHVGNITNHNLLGGTTSDVGVVSVAKPGTKKRMKNARQEHPNTEHARELPDLNNISFESGSIRKEFETVNLLSPELKSGHPRSLSACSSHTKTVNFDKVQDNGESPGTFLFLQFAPGPGVDIPSKDDLLKTFCRFGPLKASETQFTKDNVSAQIAFVRNTDAAEAFRNLEQNNPFGATLVGYRLHHPPAVAPPSEQVMTPTLPTRHPPAVAPPSEQVMTPTQPTRHPPAVAPPSEQVMTPTQPTRPMPMLSETTPLEFIKQNLQMMTLALEKSGNRLSPQKRARLESEINNLLQKVNSRAQA